MVLRIGFTRMNKVYLLTQETNYIDIGETGVSIYNSQDDLRVPRITGIYQTEEEAEEARLRLVGSVVLRHHHELGIHFKELRSHTNEIEMHKLRAFVNSINITEVDTEYIDETWLKDYDEA